MTPVFAPWTLLAQARPRLAAFAVLVALVAAFPAGARAEPEVFPLAELEPGLRGTITTVLTGSEREEIEVEILGVLDDGIAPGVPMVIGRFVGERGQWTGVAAGMSGSPVTVDGRLLGALSYSIGSFAKEPICGITPIDTMLALEELPGGMIPWTVEPSEPVRGGHAPVPLALVGRGFTPAGLDAALERLREAGLHLRTRSVPAAAGIVSSAARSLEPGGAVAALLVWGDLVLGATGTVTAREGDELLAFGHPFLGFGRVALPMAPAEIIWTVPSELSSFKMARIGEPIGTIEQDRLTAIRGRVGNMLEGLPMRVAIHREGRDVVERSVEMMRDPLVTPALGAIVLSNVLLAHTAAERDESMTMSARFELASGRAITVEASGPSPGAATTRFSAALLSRLSGLLQAPMPVPEVERIEVDVRAREPFGSLTLLRALPERLAARPGESLRVTVEMRGPRGERRRERLVVDVPDDARPGRHALFAGSSRSLSGVFGSAAVARQRTARSAAAYLDALDAQVSDSVLELRLARGAEGMITEGGRYPALPGSAHILLRSRPGREQAYRSRYLSVAGAALDLGRPVAQILRVPLEIVASSGESP